VLPTLAALRARANEIAARVVRENAGKWESASPRDLERVGALAAAVVNRLLHDPTMKMKELRDDRVHARMAIVRELFGLEADQAVQEPVDEHPEPLAEVRELRSSRR
jgi:glutamyl-tRNA reductase